VAKDEHYDKSVDVYSFGIVLWEICSLEKPFKGYCSKKHMSNVIVGGERPKMDHSHTSTWPVRLQCLMKSCWTSNPPERPSFESIKNILEVVMLELSEDHSERIRNRSVGSQEDTNKFPNLSQVKKLKIHGMANLRVKSLGLKRAQSD
jgi:serine/threonine protein kinase